MFGKAQMFFVPRSYHVDQYTFHISVSSLKVHHLYLLISQESIRFLTGTQFLSVSNARCHADQFTFHISLPSFKLWWSFFFLISLIFQIVMIHLQIKMIFFHLPNSHKNCLQTSMMKFFNFSQRRFFSFWQSHLFHAHSLHGRDIFVVFHELHYYLHRLLD